MPGVDPVLLGRLSFKSSVLLVMHSPGIMHVKLCSFGIGARRKPAAGLAGDNTVLRADFMFGIKVKTIMRFIIFTITPPCEPLLPV